MYQIYIQNMGKPKGKSKKSKPIKRVEENAPPQEDMDAFNLDDMIEEVDPSTVVVSFFNL